MMSSLGTLCELFDSSIDMRETDIEYNAYVDEMAQFVRKPMSMLPANIVLLAPNLGVLHQTLGRARAAWEILSMLSIFTTYEYFVEAHLR